MRVGYEPRYPAIVDVRDGRELQEEFEGTRRGEWCTMRKS